MKTLLAVVVAALVLAGGAAAKELRAVTVCGADGCRATDDPSLLQALGTQMAAPDHPSALDELPARPYYKVAFRMKGDATNDPSFVVHFVPPDLLQPAEQGSADEPVFRLPPRTASLFRLLIDGREPLSATGGGTSWRTPAAVALLAVWLPVMTGLIVRARRRRSA